MGKLLLFNFFRKGNDVSRASSTEGLQHTHGIDPDVSEDGLLQRRRASASVTEIHDLYSALQELVPTRSQSISVSSSCLTIPEEGGMSVRHRAAKEQNGLNEFSESRKEGTTTAPESIPIPQLSNDSSTFSKSRMTKSKSCHTLAVPDNQEGLVLSPSPRRSTITDRNSRSRSRSPKLRRRDDENDNPTSGNCIDRLAILKQELEKELDSEQRNSPKSSENTRRRRISSGDSPELTQASSPRRRSLGGSLLLNAIVNTSSASPRRNSLADALSIIAHKGEVQELIKNCKELQIQDETDSTRKHKSEVQSGLGESVEIQDQMEMLLNSISELQTDIEDYPLDQETMLQLPDFTRRASVGTEMQDLLKALQELATARDESPPLSSNHSSSSSRCNSVTEGPKKESLEELEAYFMDKLNGVSQNTPPNALPTKGKLNDKGAGERTPSGSGQNTLTRYLKNQQRTDIVTDTIDQNAFPSEEKQIIGDVTQESAEISQKSVEKTASQLMTEKLNVANADSSGPTSSFRAISPLDLAIRPRNRNTEEAVVPSKQEPNTFSTSREEWKEDQLIFAKQVNVKLQEWLTRATALSVSAENAETNVHPVKKVTPTEATVKETKKRHPTQLPRSQSKFNFKIPMKGRTKRSKSLFNTLDPEEMVEKTEAKIEMQRTPPSFRTFGRFKIPRSKSLHVSKSDTSLKTLNNRNISAAKSTPIEVSKMITNSTSKAEVKQKRETDSPRHFLRRALSDRKMTYYNHDSPSQATPQITTNTTFSPGFRTRPRTLAKRTSRGLPINLPLFYTPDLAGSAHQSKDKHRNLSYPPVNHGNPSCLIHTRPKGNEFNSEGGCTQTNSTNVSLVCSYSGGSSNSEGMIDCYFRTSSTDDELDFRQYNSKEVLRSSIDKERNSYKSESDDSGCPGSEMVIPDLGIRTEILPTNSYDDTGCSKARSVDVYAQSFYDLDSEVFEI